MCLVTVKLPVLRDGLRLGGVHSAVGALDHGLNGTLAIVRFSPLNQHAPDG